MRLVILESPYAGDVRLNIEYARAAMRDCLLRGEAPFASHLLYTQDGVLDDDIAEERQHGIEAGFAWRAAAEATVFYVDLGWSSGMIEGHEHLMKNGMPCIVRRLGPPWRNGGNDPGT